MTQIADPSPTDQDTSRPATQVSCPAFDASAALCEQVSDAYANQQPLRILGGDTRRFYGRPVEGHPLDMSCHTGVVHYDPVELVVTVRAGTPLNQLEAVLAEQHQMLAFEPPRFGPTSTVGGAVATALSGPRRPWAGAVRDLVLGTRVITQEGKLLRFGGEVMKNVAGYDMSRLMVGAQGTLGVLADISFKVVPLPASQASLALELSLAEALATLAELGRKPVPISAAAWLDGRLYLRLEGGTRSVQTSRETLGGEALDSAFWQRLRDQSLDFFSPRPDQALWRLSLPPNTPPLALETDAGGVLYDWAGSQRFMHASLPASHIRQACAEQGGHATCYTPAAQGGVDAPFTPLAPVVEKYHRKLKAQLDRHAIFNPGRLYSAF